MGFMGTSSVVVEADVVETINEIRETVMSRIPARYLDLESHADGDILKQRAAGGETSLQLGLAPCSNVLVYVNPPRVWGDRDASTALTHGNGMTVVDSTGAIALDVALQTGDVVIAEYDHGAMEDCALIRRIIVDMVAAEWARRLFPDDQRWDRYAEWERSAWMDLSRMNRKDGERMGIAMFDRLKLVHETQAPRMVGGGGVDLGGGMM